MRPTLVMFLIVGCSENPAIVLPDSAVTADAAGDAAVLQCDALDPAFTFATPSGQPRIRGLGRVAAFQNNHELAAVWSERDASNAYHVRVGATGTEAWTGSGTPYNFTVVPLDPTHSALVFTVQVGD